MNFQQPRNVRRENITVANYTKTQRLTPVMAMLVEGSEGGMISENIMIELDPIPGRLLTPITAEMHCVFVPMQDIDALLDPQAQYAGMTEVVREKLLTGNALFPAEADNEIAQRCGIIPQQVNGGKKLNRMVRVGHNCAVNFLRRRLHKDAALLGHANASVTPALLSETILDRFNGVLDPDDRINGAVQLRLPQMTLPVSGVTQLNNSNPGTFSTFNTSSDGDIRIGNAANNQVIFKRNAGNPAGADLDITATLNAVTAGNVSLSDFYNAETMDKLTRTMGQIMEQNPQYGQEMILRWAHGLSVDPGRVPFMLAFQRKIFSMNMVSAMDTAGVNNETIRSDMSCMFNFSVPIPKTELGGMIYVFLSVKPDETVASQPHPILRDNYGLRNHVADQLALDPVPVTMRQLDANVLEANENTVAFYTGLNELARNYTHYGFGRNVDLSQLTNKMAIWQLQLPLSVTPTTILHPQPPDQSIFAVTTGNPVRYTCAHSAMVLTPITYGPSPVETLPIIDSADIFEDA